MKRVVIYALITVGALVSLLAIMVLAVIIITNDPDQRAQYGYTVGYIYGTLLVILFGILILFALFKLTQAIFFKKNSTADDQVLDKDGPIDRYLK